jgi:hypothetical protein
MEDDEWVNIQVDAVDNVSMDRVEFLLDGYRIEETTVAPYSARWTIVMSDTVPTGATVITQTETVTSPEGIVSEQVVVLTEVITVPDPLEPTEPLQFVQVYSGGLTIISDTLSSLTPPPSRPFWATPRPTSSSSSPTTPPATRPSPKSQSSTLYTTLRHSRKSNRKLSFCPFTPDYTPGG